GQADAAPRPLRQALARRLFPSRWGGFGGGGRAELFPGVAAVVGAVQAAAGPAADELPGAAAGPPQGGAEDARAVWVAADVDGAGVGGLFEDLLPGLAAVGGAVDAALGVGAEGAAEDGGVGDVGVARVDDNLADLAGLFPEVFPGLAAVGRAVDAVAGGDVA